MQLQTEPNHIHHFMHSPAINMHKQIGEYRKNCGFRSNLVINYAKYASLHYICLSIQFVFNLLYKIDRGCGEARKHCNHNHNELNRIFTASTLLALTEQSQPLPAGLRAINNNNMLKYSLTSLGGTSVSYYLNVIVTVISLYSLTVLLMGTCTLAIQLYFLNNI